MSSMSVMSLAPHRSSGSLMAWMTALPPGLSILPMTPKYGTRCSWPTASIISMLTTLSKVPAPGRAQKGWRLQPLLWEEHMYWNDHTITYSMLLVELTVTLSTQLCASSSCQAKTARQARCSHA